jgi:hypothetical protein
MTTIDDSKIIRDILDTNWNAGNVTKPALYYKDDVKNHDYRSPAIKVYHRSLTRKVQDVTFSYHQINAGVSIDIKSPDRDTMLALRDEVVRCLNVVRKAPDSNYSLLLFDSERQVTGYSGFWHYVIDVTLRNNARQIVTA